MVALEPAQPFRPLLVVRLGLGPLGDATHRGHHLRRSDPDRGLGRQHQRVGAVEHGVGDVADLGPGRRRGGHHRLQHLRGRDHRDAELDALPHDRLLQVRHVLERAVDAEVAPGDHDRVRHGEDLGEVPERRARLDLGDELGAIADDLADRRHVGRRADERHGDELDSGRRHRLGEHQVLLGRRREPRPLRGQVDTGAALCPPAVLDHGDGRGRLEPLDPSADRTVADDHPIADRQVVEERRRSRRGSRSASLGPSPTSKRITDPASSWTPGVSELPARIFGPGRSASTPIGLPTVDRDRPHAFETIDVLGDGSVAEVEPHHVDTGSHEGDERIVAVGRRPEGGDDLRATGHTGCSRIFERRVTPAYLVDRWSCC